MTAMPSATRRHVIVPRSLILGCALSLLGLSAITAAALSGSGGASIATHSIMLVTSAAVPPVVGTVQGAQSPANNVDDERVSLLKSSAGAHRRVWDVDPSLAKYAPPLSCLQGASSIAPLTDPEAPISSGGPVR